MRQDDLIEELRPHIQANFKKSPLLINISGCTGSGKSTWAELISEEFLKTGSKVIHISEDDFLQPRDYRDSLPRQKWANHENWLRLDLMKEVIKNLRENKSSIYFPYLRDTGEFSRKEKIVKPAEIVIFETSVFSDLFDVVVLIEVNNKILLERKLNRDNDLRSKERIRKYHEVQLDFWNLHKPRKPEYIIYNDNYKNPKLEIVSKNE